MGEVLKAAVAGSGTVSEGYLKGVHSRAAAVELL